MSTRLLDTFTRFAEARRGGELLSGKELSWNWQNYHLLLYKKSPDYGRGDR